MAGATAHAMSDSLTLRLPLLSVVVPVRNEEDNILPLVAEIQAALAGVSHEIVYVDDGSTDGTGARLREAGVVWRRHRVSCGQSAAVVTGVRVAQGEWIATLDGDGQNDPADIPALLERVREDAGPGPLLVAGHRTRRRDSWTKRQSSWLANRVRAGLLHDATPDTGCGLKLFRRSAFLELPHFDHMHRYLPALFIRAGGRVTSVPVNHRPRTRGHSNYGTLDRALGGAVRPGGGVLAAAAVEAAAGGSARGPKDFEGTAMVKMLRLLCGPRCC